MIPVGLAQPLGTTSEKLMTITALRHFPLALCYINFLFVSFKLQGDLLSGWKL